MTVAAPTISQVLKSDATLYVSWIPDDENILSLTEDDGDYVVDVDSWSVLRSTTETGDYTEVVTGIDANTLYWEDDTGGLSAGTEYWYSVRGVYAAEDGLLSDPLNGTTAATPTAPSAIAAADVYGSIVVTWTSTADDETSILIQRNTDGGAYADLVTLPPRTTSYTDSDVTVIGDPLYRYRVRTQNGAGNSAYSTLGTDAFISGVYPAVPDTLTAVPGTGSIVVGWAINEPTYIDTHEIQRSLDTGQTWTTLDDTIGPLVDSYEDIDLDQGDYAMYRVRVVDAGTTNSQWSAVIGGIAGGLAGVAGYQPTPPRMFRSTSHTTSAITYEWADCSESEDGYEIQYRRQGATSWTFTRTAANIQTKTVSSLLAGVTYEAQCRALSNTGLPSDWTPSDFTTTEAGGGSAPTAPSAFVLEQVGTSNGINASWTDNSNDEAGFVMEFWRADSPSTLASIDIPVAGTTGSVIPFDPADGEALRPGQTYSAHVLAYNSAGQRSAWSNASVVTLTGGDPPFIYAPTNLRGGEITQNSLAMSWENPNLPNVPVQAQVWRSLTSSTTNFIFLAPTSGSAFTDIGIGPNTNAWYKIRFRQSVTGVRSEYSEVLALRTLPGRPPVPEAPTLPGVVEISATVARVAWSYPSAQTVHSEFRVYQTETAGSGYVLAATVIASSRTVTITGLTAGTTYYFVVAAANSAEESAYSDEVDVTMTASVAVPDAASGLTGTLIDQNAVVLSWLDNSDNETGFKVQRSTTGGGVGFSTIDTTAADVTAYRDVDLTLSTTYYYRIVATNGTGDGTASDEVTVTTGDETPALPLAANLRLYAASSRSVLATWDDPGGNAASFDLLWGTSAGSLSSTATPGAGVFSYEKTGLTPNTTYYAKIQSINTGGTTNSDVVSVTTPRESSTGEGPGGEMKTYVIPFDKDAEDQTLIPTGLSCVITNLFIYTPDPTDGPHMTISVGATPIITTNPYSGTSQISNYYVRGGGVTAAITGTGTGIGYTIMTIVVL